MWNAHREAGRLVQVTLITAVVARLGSASDCYTMGTGRCILLFDHPGRMIVRSTTGECQQNYQRHERFVPIMWAQVSILKG